MDNFLHLMFWENVVGGLKVKGDGINVTEVVGRVIFKKNKSAGKLCWESSL